MTSFLNLGFFERFDERILLIFGKFVDDEQHNLDERIRSIFLIIIGFNKFYYKLGKIYRFLEFIFTFLIKNLIFKHSILITFNKNGRRK